MDPGSNREPLAPSLFRCSRREQTVFFSDPFLCRFVPVLHREIFAEDLSCGADFVQRIGNKCFPVVRLGNDTEEMKTAAKAVHPSVFIDDFLLRGDDLNL
jgi:hypothetical protein